MQRLTAVGSCPPGVQAMPARSSILTEIEQLKRGKDRAAFAPLLGAAGAGDIPSPEKVI